MERKHTDPNPVQLGIRVVIGGYLIWMAVQMVKNTLTGASSMSLPVTLILGGLMALAGAALVLYGLWPAIRKKK